VLATEVSARVPRGPETQSVASSLLRSGRYADPFRYETGPTAHVAPVYPLYLAALMQLFPDARAYGTARSLLSALAASVQWALLPLLATRLALPRRVGVLASLLAIGTLAALPRHVQVLLETQGAWEHVHAALALVGLCLLAAHVLAGRRFTPALAVAYGAAWGASLLLAPSLAIVFALWLVGGFALAHSRAFLRFALLASAVLLATLAPWTVRNAVVMGSPVWGRDNLGLELYVANNDCAGPSFADNLRSGCHGATHPNVSAEEAQKVRVLGEVAYNRQRMADALDWVRSHPRRFGELSAERFLLYWFPVVQGPLTSLPLWTVSALGLAGAVLAIRARPLAAWLLGGTLAVHAIAYYFVQHLLRYRYPVLWISFLLAAYALERAGTASRAALVRRRAARAPLRNAA
jgi:hypothetical protein